MSEHSYLLNEIYACLQGEGPNLGCPSLLVRFQICNLRCTWCDTPYTHTYKSDPVDSFQPQSGQKYNRISLTDLVKQIQEQPLKHLIFSGGEPTLQNIGLLFRGLNAGYSAEVESNGTRIPHRQISGFLKSDYFSMQWNISPKFSNAGEKIIPEALQYWSNLAKEHPRIFFKFVVRFRERESDIAEILALCKEFFIPAERVYLMPEGTTRESQMGNIWLHDYCCAHGFRYTPRLHVILFGNERGV